MKYSLFTGSKEKLEDTIQEWLDGGWLLHGQTFMTGGHVSGPADPEPTEAPETIEPAGPPGPPKESSVNDNVGVQEELDHKPQDVEKGNQYDQYQKLVPEFAQAMICHDDDDGEGTDGE